MEFNNMRVKVTLSHSSCILFLGFFTNNDEEHFYSLSNNGQLKEWLLNPDGSIILIETSYLLRPGSEYLDYIGFPPTENSINGHNIIISALTIADNLLFLGYEDGLVLVWNQERRDVIDKNILKSWKRSRTMVRKEENEKKSSLIINSEENKQNTKNGRNNSINEQNEENEEEEELESKNNLNLNMDSQNNSHIYSEEESNKINNENKKNENNNNMNRSNSTNKKRKII